MLHDLAKTREHFELLRKLTGTGQNPVPRSPDSARWALRVPPVEQLHQHLRVLPAFSRRPEPSGVCRAANCAQEGLRSFTAMDSRHPEHFPVLTERSGAHRASLDAHPNVSGRSPEPPGSSESFRGLTGGAPSIAPSFGSTARPAASRRARLSTGRRLPPGVLGRPPEPSGSTEPFRGLTEAARSVRRCLAAIAAVSKAIVPSSWPDCAPSLAPRWSLSSRPQTLVSLTNLTSGS
jgi:hypothetical protein